MLPSLQSCRMRDIVEMLGVIYLHRSCRDQLQRNEVPKRRGLLRACHAGTQGHGPAGDPGCLVSSINFCLRQKHLALAGSGRPVCGLASWAAPTETDH